MVSVVYWSSFQLDNTSESIHVINGSGSSNFRSKSMSSDGGHGDSIFIHEPHDIV